MMGFCALLGGRDRLRASQWGRYALGLIVPLAVSGCGLSLAPVFAPGTYSGDLLCELVLVDPDGTEARDGFPTTMTVVVNEGGAITVNDTPIAVGEEATRSLPTADLPFEITAVMRRGGVLSVDYEPRPTLPGIAVDGTLRETFERDGDGIHVEATANLTITDVSGTATLTVACAGSLGSSG